MENVSKKCTESSEPDSYKLMIDNVLSQVENVFVAEGVDKSVLEKLRETWTLKVESSKQASHNNDVIFAQKGNFEMPCSPEENCLISALEGNLKLTPVVNLQTDGALDSSEDENGATSDDAASEDNDEDKDPDEQDMDDGGPEEEPLGSGDDITDEEDPSDLFDTDNVIVCQYEKITRIRNKWKFHLKYGIMNLNGEDYVFQKADGDAEW